MNWNAYNPFLVIQYPFINCVWVPNPKPEQPTIDFPEPSPHPIIAQPPIPQPQQPQVTIIPPRQKNQSSNLMQKKRNLRKLKLQKKRDRQDNFEQKKQKKDRNIPSNIFKYFLAHIAKSEHLGQLIKKLFENSSSVQALSFKLKVKQYFKNNNGYIRQLTIKELCQNHYLNQGESLLFRVILRRFLLLDLPLQIVQMSKYKKRQRRQFIKLARTIYNQIMQKCQTS